MRKVAQKFIILVFGAMILVWLCADTVAAQGEIGVYPPIKRVSRTKTTGGGGGNRRKPVVIRTERTKVVTREVRTTVTVTTSNLSVTTQPGAEVSLVPLAGGAPKKQIADSKGVTVFQDLKPAVKYNVVAKLEGFNTLETEDPVIVPARKTIGIKLELKPITYDLKIKLNIRDGEVRFAPSVPTGRKIGESIETRETRGYCVVKVENGEAVIPALEKGYYNLIVNPAAVEYQPNRAIVQVPEDILDEDESGETEKYEMDLEKKVSIEQFASAWTNSEWELPNGWRLSNNKMQTNSLAGVALPSNEQFRYYVDFELMTNVKSLDENTVGFVFRAQDANNYYLVELSGKNAAEPYRAKGYVVKKGVRSEPIFTIDIKNVANIIKEQFRFIIRSEGNTFKFFIEDSTTGDNLPLGNMFDRDSNFKKGAVGIAGSANSKFEVVFFTVLCRGNCR